MAYRVAGYGGVAFSKIGPETVRDWETGEEEETGKILMRMIGDDRLFPVDPEDIEPLPRGAYCLECGQIGCGHAVEDDE